MVSMRYGLLCLMVLTGVVIGNEFVKKAPTQIRKEKAQREAQYEQSCRNADELLMQSLNMQSQLALFAKELYGKLRSVACGESSILEIATLEELKKINADLEQCKQLLQKTEEAIRKTEKSLKI